MSGYVFCSCLTTQIETFISLRQLSGTDYHSQVLFSNSHFDQFLIKSASKINRLTGSKQWNKLLFYFFYNKHYHKRADSASEWSL